MNLFAGARRAAVVATVLAVGCKSQSTGITCVADNVCQPACAADPDCAEAIGD